MNTPSDHIGVDWASGRDFTMVTMTYESYMAALDAARKAGWEAAASRCARVAEGAQGAHPSCGRNIAQSCRAVADHYEEAK